MKKKTKILNLCLKKNSNSFLLVYADMLLFSIIFYDKIWFIFYSSMGFLAFLFVFYATILIIKKYIANAKEIKQPDALTNKIKLTLHTYLLVDYK